MAIKELERISAPERSILEQFTRSYPVKVGELAKTLGVTVKISSLGTGISGQISLEGEKFIIKINRNESRERQRFTIAHELAHFLLHKDYIRNSINGITDNVLYRSGAPQYIEYEANRLGAEIIMPTSSTNTVIQERFGGIVSEDALAELASIFEVSKAAMEIRLQPTQNLES